MSEDGESTLPALEGLLAVIAQGPLTGSNKLMLILALIDLAPLSEGDFISYEAIAGQMLQIGLEQTSPFDEMVLRQVTSGNRDHSVVTAATGLESALQGL